MSTTQSSERPISPAPALGGHAGPIFTQGRECGDPIAEKRAKSRARYRAWALRNRDKIRANSRRWYAKHRAEQARAWANRPADDRERDAERLRAWYSKNSELAKARARAYYAANKKRALENVRSWVKANPDKRKAAWQRWSANNRKQANAAIAAWKQANPELVSHYGAKRRAAACSTSAGSSPKFIRQFYATARRISTWTGIPFEVDHIVPIAKGGKHTESNLQVIPAGINRRKSARLDYVLP